MKKIIPIVLAVGLILTVAVWGVSAAEPAGSRSARQDLPEIRLAAVETIGRGVPGAPSLPSELIPMMEWTEGTALLAEAGDAAFYGQSDGSALLRWGDVLAEFDWLYATPRAIAPRLWLADADGDGAEELLVRCYGGSGTGVSLEFLYVVEKTAGGLVSREFPVQVLRDTLREPLEVVTSDGAVYAALGRELVDITAEMPRDTLPRAIRLGIGQIAEYIRTEAGLTGSFAVRMEVGPQALPGPYVAEVQACICYQEDGSFVVSDLHLLS